MGAPKLNDEEVIEICKAYQAGEGLRSLQRRFNISAKSITMLLRKQTYKHVNREVVNVRLADQPTAPEVVECILRLYKPYHKRYSASGLARIFKLHHKTVAEIIKRGH